MPVRLRQVLRLRIFKQGLLEVPTYPYLEIDCHRRAWHLLPRRTCVRARLGACPRGLAAWGAGRPVGLVSRGGLNPGWAAIVCWIFGTNDSLLSVEIDTDTTDHTTEPQSARDAHRSWRRFGLSSQLLDLMRLKASCTALTAMLILARVYGCCSWSASMSQATRSHCRNPGGGFVRALAWTLVPAWACRLGGREAGRAWYRGACLRKGQHFRGLDSLERMWICYYY
jgi:hypothetical protein